MAGEIQLNGTTALTESGGSVTLNNVDSATNRTNLGLGTAATSASTDFVGASRTITAGTGLSGGGDLSANRTLSVDYASTSEVQGTHTTGTVTSGTTSLTVASGSGISDGDYVVGQGITPGTTVSSGGGTTSITLSANAGATLSSAPVSFYKANKVLSPGLVAGGLCRAWIQIDGTTTPTITSSFNFSSVTDTADGIITATFTTAMPDNKYAVLTTGTRNDPESAYDQSHAEELNTTYYKIRTGVYSTGPVTTDFDLVSSVVFR